MSLDPMPLHGMTLRLTIQFLPQILVFDGLFAGGAPIVFLPAMYPVQYALAHILGIGEQVDLTTLPQCLQGVDRRQEFHPVVGCLGLASRDDFFVLLVYQQRTPAAGPRIATTGAIGINTDVFQRDTEWDELSTTTSSVALAARWVTGCAIPGNSCRQRCTFAGEAVIAISFFRPTIK